MRKVLVALVFICLAAALAAKVVAQTTTTTTVVRYTFGASAITVNGNTWSPIPTSWFSSTAWHWASCTTGLTGIYAHQLAVDAAGEFKVTIPLGSTALPTVGTYVVTAYFEGCPSDTKGSRVFGFRILNGTTTETNFWPEPAGPGPLDLTAVAPGSSVDFELGQVLVGSGGLVLDFDKVNNDPIIAAVAIQPCGATCPD